MISIGLALSSRSSYSMKSQESSEICKPSPFVGENKADSFLDEDSHSSIENLPVFVNLVQLKASHKSTKPAHLQQFQLDNPNMLNRQWLKKHYLIQEKENELEELNFENPFEFDSQDAAKRFAVFREEAEEAPQQENSFLFGNHQQQHLIEEDDFNGINRPKRELNTEFNQKYQSLMDKYFAVDHHHHQEIDFKFYEEYLDLMEEYFGVDLLVQQQ